MFEAFKSIFRNTLLASGGDGNSSGLHALQCEDQLFIPAWKPQNVTTGDIVARGSVYLFIMAYIFLGLSHIADKFMASIEFITSKKKEVQVTDEFGRPKTIVVHIWNETVANMTLMAMGCSAPEILLGIIEVVGKGFEADELGPGVAVGSAAINLFLVVGICNLSLPRGQVRRIKRVSVFLVNAIWSLFSFCWLFIILKWSSPGVVETWEGIVTFLFFPLTVISAYLVDIRVAGFKTLSKTYGIGRHGVIVETTADEVKLVKTDFSFKHSNGKHTDEIPDIEDHRQSFIKAMKSVRNTHPVSTPRDLELLAEKKVLEETTIHQAAHQPLSLLICGPSMESSKTIFELGAPSSVNGFHKSPSSSSMNDNVARVLFRPGHLTVLKKSGELNATVVREGGDLKRRLLVDYTTEDCEALADRDYVPLLGTLAFEPDETSKTIGIQIQNDEVYRGDLLFCIRLFNIRIDEEADYPEESVVDQLHSFKIDPSRLFPPTIIESPRNSVVSETGTETYIPGSSRIPAITVTNVDLAPIPSPITKYQNQAVSLGSPSIATVLILDNGHQGIFSLAESNVTITESVGTYDARILRCGGTSGRVAVPYCTKEGTAKQPRDYEHCEGEVIFEVGETEKNIPLMINVNTCYQKDAFFYFKLQQPRQITNESYPENWSRVKERSLKGRVQLGDVTTTIIRLRENKAFKNSVDKLLKKANVSLTNGCSAWGQQFTDLLHIDMSDGEESEKMKKPGFFNYFLHILNFPWKLAAAFVPPESLMNGYPCFVGSVAVLGLLSSLLGDFATLFGCTVKLDDSVTAVALVAFGTTVPDLLVSRSAAIRDKHADASINNVFASKSLNVYFGIGVAWSSAAIYHELNGETFYVDPGNLAFGVCLYVGLAAVCIVVLLLRRIPTGGGELGGPLKHRLPMSLIFLISWLTYLVLHICQVYGYIDGF